MANGAYHGRKKHGINIHNPLALPVQVRLKSETGALRNGDGKESWRVVRPKDTIYVGLKGSCQVDIEVYIIRYSEIGTETRVGQAGFEHTKHKSSTTGETVPAKEMPGVAPPGHEFVDEQEEIPVEPDVEIRSLGEMMEDMKKEEVAV